MSRQQQAPVTPAGVELPEHLRAIKQLGRGAYGTVYLCEDVRTGAQVAVKHVRHAARHGKSMLREIRLLARLRHENLLHLIDFPAVPSARFEDVFLVLPYMPADLHKVIHSRQTLTEKHRQFFMVQILRALSCLHAAGVAHRDLKPANILLTPDCKLKVCDFGLARGDMLDGEADEGCGVLTEYVVTRWYRAPEVMLLPKQYTCSVDLWSVGCILGEILGRKAMFPGKDYRDMVSRTCQLLGSPKDSELSWLPKDSAAYNYLRQVCPQSSGKPLDELYPHASPACVDLLRALLRWDPQQRPTASEALDSEYLAAYQPKHAPMLPEPFDWSFDGFKATTEAVRERLYRECARYHPEILVRDGFFRAGGAPQKPPLPAAASPSASRRPSVTSVASLQASQRSLSTSRSGSIDGAGGDCSAVAGSAPLPKQIARTATPVRSAAAAAAYAAAVAAAASAGPASVGSSALAFSGRQAYRAGVQGLRA